MFLWFALGFATLVGATWGYAQWATDAIPWAFALIPVAAIGATVLVTASLVGQRLGAQQMVELRSVVYEAAAGTGDGSRQAVTKPGAR
jgi:Na+-driven multidrug efflux pump